MKRGSWLPRWLPHWLAQRNIVEPETLAALLFFISSTYIMTLLQLAGDMRHIRFYGGNGVPNNSSRTLPDAGHELLPYFNNERLLDLLVNSMAIVAVVRVLFTEEPQRPLRRLLWMQAVIHCLRGVTLFVTTLPNPYTNDCIDSSRRNIFYLALRVSFRLSITCSDITVSGHSATTTSAVLFQLLYTPMSSTGSLVCVCYMVGVWLLIIASRYHYTVDVVLGVLITFSVYSMYHLALMAAAAPSSDSKPSYSFVDTLAQLVWRSDGIYRRREYIPTNFEQGVVEAV